MRRKKSWGETHFLSLVWITKKNTRKKMISFQETFFSLLKNTKFDTLKLLK